jgi:hypothetical protein
MASCPRWRSPVATGLHGGRTRAGAAAFSCREVSAPRSARALFRRRRRVNSISEAEVDFRHLLHPQVLERPPRSGCWHATTIAILQNGPHEAVETLRFLIVQVT